MIQGVEFNRLMLEMRAMQTEAMAGKKPAATNGPATAGEVPAVRGPSFSELLGQAVNKVNEVQQTANQLSTAFEMGESGVDLTDVMVATQKASISFQGMTQVRNKLVQAYQDVMNMPV